MKVLFNAPSLNVGGGVSSYSASLLGCLRVNTVHFAVGQKLDSPSPRRRVLRLLRDYFNFFCLLRSGDFNLVHINPSLAKFALIRDALFLLLAKLCQKKVVVFIHGWDEDCEKRIKKSFKVLFSLIFNCADTFVVLAEEFKKKLFDMGIKRPIYLETTIVEDEIFEMQIKKQRNEFFKILFLARIEKNKGIYQAMDAYHIINNDFPFVRMTIAGDGTELGAAKEYAASRNLDNIDFTGFIRGDAKQQVFLDADVYLFPTTYGEGMPTTVLEAMAYELPVITRTVGGLKDFFVNGRMGYITDSKEPSVLADYIKILIRDHAKSEEISKFNREYARERFAASKVAERVQTIYQATIEDQK